MLRTDAPCSLDTHRVSPSTNPYKVSLCKPSERDLLCASPLYQCQPASVEIWIPHFRGIGCPIVAILEWPIDAPRCCDAGYYPEMRCGGKYRASAEIRSPAGRELLDERSARERWVGVKQERGRAGISQRRQAGTRRNQRGDRVSQEQGFQHARSAADWPVTPLASGAGTHKVRLLRPSISHVPRRAPAVTQGPDGG